MNIDKLLKIAVEKKASDLHLSAGLTPMVRVHGKLQALADHILENSALEHALKSIMPEEHKELLESDFSYAIKNVAHFRVNCFYQSRGVAAVFRIIPKNIPTLEDIYSPAILKKLCALSQGLLLITGASGVGKSTTMAAMIHEINQTAQKHIITIENPIEFVYDSKHSMINQREVGGHTRNYADALRAALREDPDVIIVGEMRDIESIRLTLTAAETGHLVISTLHASSAIDAIDRIINVFSAEEQTFTRCMLAMSLQAIISQELLPKKNDGLIAAYEVLTANPAVRHLIRENKLHQLSSVMQTSSIDGMITKEQAVQELKAKKLI